MLNCRICKQKLTDDPRSRRYDCGGDCRQCMAESGDPGCIESMEEILVRQVIDRTSLDAEGVIRYLKSISNEDPYEVQTRLEAKFSKGWNRMAKWRRDSITDPYR